MAEPARRSGLWPARRSGLTSPGPVRAPTAARPPEPAPQQGTPHTPHNRRAAGYATPRPGTSSGNVAVLVETPKGQAGRPSKSLSLEQASALLAAAEGTRMHAYITLCLATGIHTEEARALRWEHVDFGNPMANRDRRSPAPPARTALHPDDRRWL